VYTWIQVAIVSKSAQFLCPSKNTQVQDGGTNERLFAIAFTEFCFGNVHFAYL
jgi:hypothetical protein